MTARSRSLLFCNSNLDDQSVFSKNLTHNTAHMRTWREMHRIWARHLNSLWVVWAAHHHWLLLVLLWVRFHHLWMGLVGVLLVRVMWVVRVWLLWMLPSIGNPQKTDRTISV